MTLSEIHRVEVLYPRGIRTGGPKCLHQLVDTLRRLGKEAHLVPLPGTESNPRVSEYEKYDAPERSRLSDESGVFTVTPETSFRAVKPLRESRVGVWWLSTDFAVPFELKKARQREASALKMAKIVTRNTVTGEYGAFRRMRKRGLKNFAHFAHSFYAFSEVASSFELSPLMLSDYTEPENEVDGQAYREEIERVSNRVTFNPKKGADLVKKVADSLPEVEFVPLIGLSREDVIRTLKTSAIYLDLGHFPGKDHLPREAARAGTPILLANRGSAAYAEDFPFLDDYRLPVHGPTWEQRAIEKIRLMLAEPDRHRDLQSEYRLSLNAERATFENEVRLAFMG